MQQEITHIIPIAFTDFWETCFFSSAYTKAEHLDGLSCSEFSIVEEYSGAPAHKRVLFSVPPLNIPSSLQKIVGNRIGYTEHGTFDPVKKQYHFSLVPTVLPNKISIKGYYTAERVDDMHTKRTCFLETSVSIFGVGKKMEGVIAQSNEDVQKKTAAFAARWMSQSR